MHAVEHARALPRTGHRLTKPYHPWTNGRVERLNRTSTDATVHRHHYDTPDQLRARRQLFLNADNHARRLKAFAD